jgi:hypothetical protein
MTAINSSRLFGFTRYKNEIIAVSAIKFPQKTYNIQIIEKARIKR